MPWWLLGAHVAGGALALGVGRRSMRIGLVAAAAAPAVTAIAAIFALLGDRGEVERQVHEWVWVEGLELTLRFRLDSLALMATVLVSGIGALVFVYATGYFSPDAAGSPRFPVALLSFSTAMLGLVWADSIWTLFIFWELTSVTSFLLVGHKHVDESVRTAARRALLITGGGGLVLLAGLLVLSGETGTSILSDLEPIAGSSAALASVLILIGAATKSAQVPFHVWLPGAMAAPTPVSAYLHSATMVKAGVLLVAVVSPALLEVEAWKWLGIAFGLTSMMWGAIGALRQRDAKLILAWGTVSQLGLMITLLSTGSAKATFAGIAIVLAHAIFKAALFLVVGEVDIRTGTRDIEELGGLHRSMPIAFGVALIAAMSMAGAPPTLGFMAKEAAVEAGLGLDGFSQTVVLGGIIVGSVLTVAYTVRFLIGVFGPGPETTVAPRRLAMTVPAVTLAALTIIGWLADGVADDLVVPAASELNAKADVYELVPWPGLKTAFVISMGILAAGIVLGGFLGRRTPGAAPATVGADTADHSIDGVLRFAPKITAVVQHGSLPVYLVTLAGAAVAATIPFLGAQGTDGLVWWDHPMQGLLALVIVVSAFSGVFVESRFGAALTLGAVGVAITGVFVLHGAPDLALTQLMVETVIVVGFVLGLGKLGRGFPEVNLAWRNVRMVVAVLGGIGVTLALAASGANSVGSVPVDDLAQQAVDEGGGKNIVNVVLTDVRALDTLGEVVVLGTVAMGILALARVREDLLRSRARKNEASAAALARRRSPDVMVAIRTPIVRFGVRLATPLAVMVAVYLFFAGHNAPGGGFAAGLALGAVVTLRTVAGISRPVHADRLVAGGVIVATVVAIMPVLWGDPLLDQVVGSIDVPLLGTVKSGSAAVFDLGVTAIVVGLIVALLDGLDLDEPAPVPTDAFGSDDSTSEVAR